MGFIQDKYYKREKRIRRNYEIEDKLYTKLEEITKVYEVSVTELINGCIEYLIREENIKIYEREEAEISISHSLLIRESNIIGLDILKNKYGINITKLVNIAIRNALEEL